MIHSPQDPVRTLFRIATAVVAISVLVVTVVFAPAPPDASASDKKTAVFGTVSGKPENDRIDIATRSGVITLRIDEDTKIRGKKKRIKLADVVAGMTVAGYYKQTDGEPVARKLTFVTRKQKKSFKHVVGVVLDRKGKSITVKTPKGELVEIESAESDGEIKAKPGSMIATVVEPDETTGMLKSTALETAQATVDRLSKSIAGEVSLAQKKLLKIRMSETAAVHMTRLYETLDEINAETQAKIEAAYAEFQASYEATLKSSSVEPITVQLSGKVLNATKSKITVQSESDGTRWQILITSATSYQLPGGAAGTLADIAPGQFVEVEATPKSATSRPVATVVRVVPAPPTVAEAPVGPTDDTITGTIVVVQAGPGESNTVVVVAQGDGSDSAASVTRETEIVVNGSPLSAAGLEVGQQVEVTLGNDGFSAKKVEAVAPVVVAPEPTATATATALVTASPVPGESAPSGTTTPPEYSIIGVIRAISETGVMLDGVQLNLIGPSVTFGSQSVGDQVELQFYVDAAGRLVVTGAGSQTTP